ncbi:MAG TPA: hypothetical protein VMP68_19970 [Candidatus Eisenbacteria bacterium]|nr:hypothetical protein [Candidatus Eisenbacteria bacterium]
MTEETPIQTARRLQRRAEQNRCSICGRKLAIQNHHVAGRNHDAELTAPLCTPCHDQITENLRRAGVDTGIADEQLRKRLLEIPLAFLEFETGLSRHTIVRARRGEPVHGRSLQLLKNVVRRVPVRK